MRKLLLAAVIVAALAGAAPAIAQPVGTWDGTGEGWCPFPVPYPSEYMKPWQEWKGRFEPNPDEVGYVFYGDWHDGDHNPGTFKGKAILSSPTVIFCRGDWYWWDERFDPPVVHHMGTFTMSFRVDGSSCHGEWIAHLPGGLYHGTMRGRWVEP